MPGYRFSFSEESAVNNAENNVKQKLSLKSDGSICLSSLYKASESASSLCTCIHTALGITASARQMISKTLLSEALSAFCWEKEQFSLKGRRHKERLSNLPEALREACNGAENSSLLSTAAREPEENPLPPCWRGTQHTSPWQSCKQLAAQQAKTMGKGAKTLLKVREGLLSGRLINQYRAFIAGGCSGLKEANDFSILSAGFVPMAAQWHAVSVPLPAHEAPSLLWNPGGWEAPSISKRYLLVVVPGTHLLYPGGSFGLFRQSHKAKIPKLSSTLYSRQDFSSQ